MPCNATCLVLISNCANAKTIRMVFKGLLIHLPSSNAKDKRIRKEERTNARVRLEENKENQKRGDCQQA